MRHLFLIFACGLAVSACQKNPELHALRPTASIVHGAPVRKADDMAKGVVGLAMQYRDREALCTGTILDNETILTAAHCVDDEPQIAVLFGANMKTAREVRRADAVVQNPKWDKTKRDGDLALIHFTGGLPPGYVPVRLVPTENTLDEGTAVELIGYGVSDPVHDKGAGILRVTESQITGRPQRDQYETDGRKSSVCFGDSGGPGFVEVDGELLQWGVAHSVITPECNEASVHTSVATYAGWIASAKAKLAAHLMKLD